MPPGVVPRKIDWQEILEVLKNCIPAAWSFQMDKEGFSISSGDNRCALLNCKDRKTRVIRIVSQLFSEL
eukprot:13723963-Ditylum_brightwellii.AAC.1